jgi:transketolase
MIISELELLAKQIRIQIIKMLTMAGSGHPAGSLDIVEVLITLYFHVMNHDPKNPDWPDRDRLIFSCGHLAPALYAVLAQVGYFPKEKLETLRQINSPLQGHPHRGSLPGIEVSSGPLGQGLSQAVGMALAAKLDKKSYKVYCIMSDGEQNEGQVWEAAMSAAKFKLNNLIAIIDRNKIQIDGKTEDIMPVESLSKKYHSFGWHVITADGNNFPDLIQAFYETKEIINKPTVIIAHMIPGKDVNFMENDFNWHGKTINEKDAIRAIKCLEKI